MSHFQDIAIGMLLLAYPSIFPAMFIYAVWRAES